MSLCATGSIDKPGILLNVLTRLSDVTSDSSSSEYASTQKAPSETHQRMLNQKPKRVEKSPRINRNIRMHAFHIIYLHLLIVSKCRGNMFWMQSRFFFSPVEGSTCCEHYWYMHGHGKWIAVLIKWADSAAGKHPSACHDDALAACAVA